MKRVLLQIILGLALVGGTTALAWKAQTAQSAEVAKDDGGRVVSSNAR